MVAAVRHDPDQRLSLASSFYDDRTDRVSIRAYRRAELAFMRRQVSRGVLASPDSGQPGSEWWRQVNEGLLRDAWEADRLVAGRSGSASRPSVSRWADFLRKPSARAWYRAHNSSVIAGYIEHRQLSGAELPVERFFMDVALGRVLYVHALVIRPRLALGRLQGAGRLVDYGVILPRMQALYDFVAADLQEPRLLGLIRDGFPVDAWDYEDRHAWTTARARTARSVLSWLTSA